ncbi:MAG: hypothetical protein ACREPI_01070 [Candidatus Dormibacterales bacterium]
MLKTFASIAAAVGIALAGVAAPGFAGATVAKHIRPTRHAVHSRHTLTTHHHVRRARHHHPGTGGPGPQPTPSPSPTHSPPVPPPGLGSGGTGPVKPDVTGLLDRGRTPTVAVGGSNFNVLPVTWLGAVQGFVVNATWADLQPVQGGPIVRPNVIDRAIAAAGGTRHFKIRIWAGEYAPAWAKSLDGSPLPTVSGWGIGRWWTPAYEAAYADLQAKLAAIYDSVPQVSDVTVSGCMTYYAEPLLKDDVDSGAPLAALLAAGYTNAQDEQCQQAAIRAHAVWRHTHSSFSFNPYSGLNPAGVFESFTESLMDYCAQVLGPRCALENNSIRYPNNPGFYGAMYAHMGLDQARYGVTVDFQTATLTKLNTAPELGLGAALAWACGGYASPVRASSVELPAGYSTDGILGTPIAYASWVNLLAAAPH